MNGIRKAPIFHCGAVNAKAHIGTGKEKPKRKTGGNSMIGIVIFAVVFSVICWAVDSAVNEND